MGNVIDHTGEKIEYNHATGGLSLDQANIVARGRKLASLNPESKQLSYARDWWKAGRQSVYCNQATDIAQSLSSAIESYEQGYREGYEGKPLDIARAKRCDDYYVGHDHGNCDRPTLEDFMLDAEKERVNPLGF